VAESAIVESAVSSQSSTRTVTRTARRQAHVRSSVEVPWLAWTDGWMDGPTPKTQKREIRPNFTAAHNSHMQPATAVTKLVGYHPIRSIS
jgi:hypothetical protein